MNFPELADYACDDRYVRLIAINDEKEGVKKLGSRSLLLGVDMDPADVDSIKDLADTLSRLYDDRDRTDAYIQGIVEGTCYNMCALLGVPLAARMVSFVGGGEEAERFILLSSSTVQLFGAEKAMFRHLESGGKGAQA